VIEAVLFRGSLECQISDIHAVPETAAASRASIFISIFRLAQWHRAGA
jgi:hypothetical protein